jgi:hypothetical protein
MEELKKSRFSLKYIKYIFLFSLIIFFSINLIDDVYGNDPAPTEETVCHKVFSGDDVKVNGMNVITRWALRENLQNGDKGFHLFCRHFLGAYNSTGDHSCETLKPNTNYTYFENDGFVQSICNSSGTYGCPGGEGWCHGNHYISSVTCNVDCGSIETENPNCESCHIDTYYQGELYDNEHGDITDLISSCSCSLSSEIIYNGHFEYALQGVLENYGLGINSTTGQPNKDSNGNIPPIYSVVCDCPNQALSIFNDQLCHPEGGYVFLPRATYSYPDKEVKECSYLSGYTGYSVLYRTWIHVDYEKRDQDPLGDKRCIGCDFENGNQGVFDGSNLCGSGYSCCGDEIEAKYVPKPSDYRENIVVEEAKFSDYRNTLRDKSRAQCLQTSKDSSLSACIGTGNNSCSPGFDGSCYIKEGDKYGVNKCKSPNLVEVDSCDGNPEESLGCICRGSGVHVDVYKIGDYYYREEYRCAGGIEIDDPADDVDCSKRFCEGEGAGENAGPCQIGESDTAPALRGGKHWRVWANLGSMGNDDSTKQFGCCGDDPDTPSPRIDYFYDNEYDDPDRHIDHCHYCVRGDNPPPWGGDSNLIKQDPGIRMWSSHINSNYAGYGCCGDDDNSIDRDSGQIYDNTYLCIKEPIKCEDLTGVNKDPHPKYMETTENMLFYWTDPFDKRSETIVRFKNNESGSFVNYELFAYNNEWYSCYFQSFTATNYAGPVGVKRYRTDMETYPLESDTGKSKDLLCVVGEYNSMDSIKSRTLPQFFECTDAEDNPTNRMVCNEEIWGITKTKGELMPTGDYYNTEKMNITTFLQPAEIVSGGIPTLSKNIDAMTYISENSDEENLCSDCIIFIKNDIIYNYEPTGNKLNINIINVENIWSNLNDINSITFIPSAKFKKAGSYFFLGRSSSGFFTINNNGVSIKSSNDLLTFLECDNFQGTLPTNINDIAFFNAGEWSFGYPTIAFISSNEVYFLEKVKENTCSGKVVKKTDSKKDNLKPLYGGYSAVSYIPIKMAEKLQYAKSSEMILGNKDFNLDIHLSIPFLCTGQDWKGDFDNSKFKEECKSYVGQDNWIDGSCCGDSRDGFESYTSNSEKNICYFGKIKVSDNMNYLYLTDHWLARNEEGIGVNLKEVIIMDGKTHGCAIDHMSACPGGGKCNSNFLNNDINKPYQGTGNILYNGDFKLQNTCQFWDVSNPEKIICANHCDPDKIDPNADNTNCASIDYLGYEETETISISQNLYHIKPNTKYHFSVWISSDDYLIGTPLKISYVYGGTNGEYREEVITKDGSKHNLVFTTPEEEYFDYSENIHKIIIEFNITIENSDGSLIYLSSAKVSSNDYLLNIKDSRDGSDIINENYKYCEAINVTGAYKDFYCGYDEKWHYIFDEETQRRVHRESFNFKTIAWADEARNGDLGILVPKSVQVAGCCFKDQCWDGKQCIEAMPDVDFGRPLLYPNASIVNINGSGYGCYKDSSGTADWRYLNASWSWNNRNFGYCINASQCLLDPAGNRTFDNNPLQFAKPGSNLFISSTATNNPYCIESGQFIEDNYCNNGEWITRTKFIIDKMMGYLQTQNSDFSIVCGNYPDVFNNISFTLDKYHVFNSQIPTFDNNKVGCNKITDFRPNEKKIDYYFNNEFNDAACVIENCQYRNTGGDLKTSAMPCVNKICVMNIFKKNGQHVNETIIAFSHNRIEDELGGNHFPLSNLFGKSGNSAKNYCQGKSGNSYSSCSSIDYGKVFYNPELQIVFYGNELTNPNGWTRDYSKYNTYSGRFLTYFWGLYNSGNIGVYSPPNELNYTNDFKDFYYAQATSGTKTRHIFTSLTSSYDRKYNNDILSTRNFDDFYSELTDFTNPNFCDTLDSSITVDDYICEEKSNNLYYALQEQSSNSFRDIWHKFTWIMRIGR